MAKYAWCTDVHFDHTNEDGLISFARGLAAQDIDGVILTGDISNANQLVYDLSIFERNLNKPVHFVCGNHDYYGGSVEDVRNSMKELTNMSQYLKYLGTLPYVSLSQSTGLIGHDGWYDGLYGNWKQAQGHFEMSDWTLIKQFAQHTIGGRPNMQMIVEEARQLAHDSVMHVHNGIKAATRYHKNLIIATHVPPFEQSHVYMGAPGSPMMQPWFTSKMMGDMLMQAAAAFPKVKFTVLSGHTHGKAFYQPVENLAVYTGAASYGSPSVADIITVT